MPAPATDALLVCILSVLQADPRITAAWLSGSRGRGTADDLSDIDIWLAVENDAIGEINADPLAFVHEIAPTIMHIQAPSIAPPGGVYLLTWIPAGEGFQQVDWYWTPASSASRASRTQLLFERQPVPVVASGPERLDPDPLVSEIDGTIRDALLMIANAWKHARRGNAWRMLAHLQHVDAALARLDGLVTHGRVPAFEETVRSFLPAAVPGDLPARRATLRSMLAALTSLAREAGRCEAFEDAIAALSNTLDA